MRWSYPIALALLASLTTLSRSWAQPLVNVETVAVGDVGNVGNAAGYGSVSYEYYIGKYEVTVGQYAAFLNSVASNDPYGLYHPSMGSDFNVAGISRSGSPGAYRYSVIGPGGVKPPGASTAGNRPIAYVTWFDAARFVNWLHNGATNGASTETGSYSLNGATTGDAPGRNPQATWVIPTEDEWVKAAYYKGRGTSSGYWTYATQSDVLPGNSIGSMTNQANSFFGLLYAVTQSGAPDSSQNYLTDAGAFSASPSAYGTFDQAGNLWEWNDARGIAGARCLRGGSWLSSDESLRSSYRFPDTPGSNQNNRTGFRVATLVSNALNFPTIVVEQPVGTPLKTEEVVSPLPPVPIGMASASRVYTIRNTGGAQLKDIVVVKIGQSSGSFSVVPPATNSLAPWMSTTFAVSFSPNEAGALTSQIHITSNDTNNSPFVINLSGFGLSEDVDSDLDGLNDAAEFTMSALGFDWQVAQPNLVTALYSNANRARLFTQLQYDANRTNGQADVTANPTSFNLFTRSQLDANYSNGVTAGISTVLSNPVGYNLYDSNSIMDLRMGGLMIQKQNNQAIVVFRIQTTTNLATQPFTNYGTPLTNLIVMPEKSGFCRIEASAGAVYVDDPNQVPPTIEPEPTPTPTLSAP